MSNAHTHDEHAGHDDHGDPCGDGYLVHAHITPVKTNLIVISILFVLTGLTVGVYFTDLGEANLAVALLIASVKATLVGTWFMHLKYEKAFNISFFLGALLFKEPLTGGRALFLALLVVAIVGLKWTSPPPAGDP